MNYYELLQVSPNADQDIIEAAAKALLKKHHPDVPNGRTSLSREILDAKNTLTDQSLRQAYDANLRSKHGNQIGSYIVTRKIAEGGFGRVFEGYHRLLDEKVCVKHNINISNYDTELFIKEAKAIWNLRHHALPAVRDMVMLDDGSCALVMSYIEGLTLMQIVEELEKKGKLLDPETGCWIMSRVLDALRYLHFNGVIHGDVKPQNVIVQPEIHSCVLVDFGLAAVRPTKASKPDGFTPLFASPESLQDKPLLPESDLYSLGLTMIYAFGGDPKNKKIPSSVPKEIRDFLSELVIYDIKQRPHWNKTDLLAQLADVRMKVFGREHTNMKSLGGK